MTRAGTDVVIVGGGLAGITTAYYLGVAGIRSVVVERDAVGSHASGFAYGGLGALGSSSVGGPMYAVAAEGMRLHRELAETLRGRTGINTEFRDRPSLSLAFTNEEAEAAGRGLSQQRPQGYRVSWLEPADLRAADRRISEAALGGLLVEGTADVEPYRLVLALTQAAEGMGATVHHGTVTGLAREREGGYRVSLERGGIRCERVVLAMGPWGAQASAWLRVPIEVRPLKGQILRLRAPGPPMRFSLGWQGNYATTKPDGLLWAGTTEEEVGFDETPTPAARDEIMVALLKMAPGLADAQLVTQTACLRPLASDRLLVLGQVPGWDGVYVATGAGRSGIVLGPAMGSIIADLIATGQTDIPIEAFDPGRFGPRHSEG